MTARRAGGTLLSSQESWSSREMKGKDKIVFMFVSFSTCALIYYSWLVHLPLR
jgi:hypothetical protein